MDRLWVSRGTLFFMLKWKREGKEFLRSCNPCNSISSPPLKINLISTFSFFLCFEHRLWVSSEVSFNVEMKKGRNFEIIKPTFPFPQKQIFSLVFLMFQASMSLQIFLLRCNEKVKTFWDHETHIPSPQKKKNIPP